MVHLRAVAIPEWVIGTANNPVSVPANIGRSSVVDRGKHQIGESIFIFLELLPAPGIVGILVEVPKHGFHVRVGQRANGFPGPRFPLLEGFPLR